VNQFKLPLNVPKLNPKTHWNFSLPKIEKVERELKVDERGDFTPPKWVDYLPNKTVIDS